MCICFGYISFEQGTLQVDCMWRLTETVTTSISVIGFEKDCLFYIMQIWPGPSVLRFAYISTDGIFTARWQQT